MSSSGRENKWKFVPILVLAMGCIPGCTATGYRHDRSAAAAQRRPTKPSQVGSVASREEAVLDAVEEFLKKTEDYQRGTTLPPDSEAVASSRNSSATIDAAANAASLLPPSSSPVIAVANSQVAVVPHQEATLRLALPVIESLSVRDTSGERQVIQAKDNASTTNSPIEAQPRDDQLTANRVISFATDRANATKDLDSIWGLRIIEHVFHRRPVDIDSGTELDPEPSRLLNALVRVADAVREVARNPLAVGHESLQRLEDLRGMLADNADPLVSGITLCRKVVTFGVYEETSPDQMIAGRTLQTIVYSEIDNLRAVKTDEGRFRSVIRTRLELLDPAGKSVWQHEEPEIVDECRRRRRDFFIAQRISLPPTIPAGNYVLKVLAEDKLSGLGSEASSLLTLTSPAAVATTR